MQIGFKNFRRFEDFPLMEVSPITIFVGENNAGKSTVIKAILSTLEFLTSYYFHIEKGNNDKAVLDHYFFFNKSYFVHIGTFARALYNRAKNNVITFTLSESNLKFEIEVIGDKSDEEAVSGKIQKLSMVFLRFNIEVCYDFINDDIKVVFNKKPNKLYHPDDRRSPYDEKVFNDEKLREYFKSVPPNAELHTSITGSTGMIGGSLLGWLWDRFTSHIETLIQEKNTKKEKNKGLVKCPQEIIPFMQKYKDLFRRYSGLLRDYDLYSPNQSKVEYIYVHSVAQTVIYSAKDTNDYLVKTIHEFANCRIKEKTKIHSFITKWMKAFNIGHNYNINSVGGEAHIVKILDKDGYAVNLADKGMGSIQLMVLLFRLATKMSNRMSPFERTSSTIILEEPEQNLHPMLQSKLADLFYEINAQYGFRLIIETHSEYLVRRSQVIIASENKKSDKWTNPFKVFYFPAKGLPYDMEYAKDGYFEKPFGKGFFNVAAELSLDLDRVEQGIYHEG